MLRHDASHATNETGGISILKLLQFDVNVPFFPKEYIMKLSHMNTEPMNNLCLGTCLAAMTPMLLGLVHDAAFVGLAPWITISFVIMIISLIYMIKNKQFVPATANAIASPFFWARTS